MPEKFASRLALTSCLAFTLITASAQTDTASAWTWIHGDAGIAQPAVYGTAGTPAPANKPGDGQMRWLDTATNLWIMSQGSHGNELWKYDRTVRQWAFIKGAVSDLGVYGSKGIADPANFPGTRSGATTWVDVNGNFWLFGGVGHSSNRDGNGFGDLSDLWMYNPHLNLWTWMAGDKVHNFTAYPNEPAMREGATGWADNNNNLWLMGGVQNYFSYRNDLWRYSIADNSWTLVRNTTTSPGTVFGQQGVSSPVNTPGAIAHAIGWTDPDNNLWMYSGDMVFDESSRPVTQPSNAIWKYTISTNQWTWVAGDQLLTRPASYGQLNIPSPDIQPGNRSGALWAADKHGNLFVYGGKGYLTATETGNKADLWKFDAGTRQWTWIKGSQQADQSPVYGQRGVAGFSNTPGSRAGGLLWVANEGEVYLMGGAQKNDLWKLTAVLKTFYADNDGDGYGDPSRPRYAVAGLPGYVANADDCNDHNASMYPGSAIPCEAIYSFTARISPNPCTDACRLLIQGGKQNEPFEVRVHDFQHLLRGQKKQLFAGESYQFGSNLRAGYYFVEIIQGDERKVMKLLKL